MNRQTFEKELGKIGFIVQTASKEEKNTLVFYRKGETNYFCKIERWDFKRHFIVEIRKKEKGFAKEPLLNNFLNLIFLFFEHEAKEKDCSIVVLGREKSAGAYSKKMGYKPALDWMERHAFDSFFKNNTWFQKPFVKELKKGYLDSHFSMLKTLFTCFEDVKKTDPIFDFQMQISYLHIQWFEYELFHRKQNYVLYYNEPYISCQSYNDKQDAMVEKNYDKEEKVIEMFITVLEKTKKEWRLKWLIKPEFIHFDHIIKWIMQNCAKEPFHIKKDWEKGLLFREELFTLFLKKGKDIYDVEIAAKKLIDNLYDHKLLHKFVKRTDGEFTLIESEENVFILRHISKEKGYFVLINVVENKKMQEIENNLESYLTKSKQNVS